MENHIEYNGMEKQYNGQQRVNYFRICAGGGADSVIEIGFSCRCGDLNKRHFVNGVVMMGK